MAWPLALNRGQTHLKEGDRKVGVGTRDFSKLHHLFIQQIVHVAVIEGLH